jgi:hypothetical protein
LLIVKLYGEVPPVIVTTKFVLLLAQIVASPLSTAEVGLAFMMIVTSSKLATHGGLLIVQRSTYVVPAVPVNNVFLKFAFAKLPPKPLTTVHKPVPDIALLPFRVTLVPHTVVSMPAFAVVGFGTTVTAALPVPATVQPLASVTLPTML